MKHLVFLITALAVAGPNCDGQPLQLTRDQMVRYTPKNPYERFEDGRPKVPESLLKRVKALSVEEAWGVMRGKGYHHQYGGTFRILHPGRKLVGRAMTAQYLPHRPDLAEVLAAEAKAQGKPPGSSQQVTDALQLHDVPVVSLMGAAEGHNFGGDNIHAAVYGVTRTGAVVDGTVRDLEGMHELPTQIYFREGHPAAVGGVYVVGMNVPVHIGPAMVMPGDVVLGDRTGVVFIPPHLVEEVLEYSETTRFKDEWRKRKFLSGRFKASDLYGGALTSELEREMNQYVARKQEELRRQ